MKSLVRVLFGERNSEFVVECRHCGTTLSYTARICPECGSDSIATYQIT